jgi:hypothetical protein
MAFLWFRNLFLKPQAQSSENCILPLAEQIDAWQKINRKMSWGIMQTGFEKVEASSPPALTKDDRVRGFYGLVLFYGFGDDGQGNSDAVFSGKIVWEYVGLGKREKGTFVQKVHKFAMGVQGCDESSLQEGWYQIL